MAGAIEVRREVSLGDRHAHAVAKALAQRPGGGLNPFHQLMLGMAGRLAAPLAELLDVVERQVVARQVQQAVKQHAAVAGGKNKAVAIGPARLARIVS